MLHFNELYVTDDNSHIVIDVEIDNFDEYAQCYIDKVTVNLAEDYCNGTGSGVVVYRGGSGLTYVDMDGDGKITERDVEQINGLNMFMKRLRPDKDGLNKYDVNLDGKVDLHDYILITDAILGRVPMEDRYDVNNDGEKSIFDVKAIIDYINPLITSSKSLFTDNEYAEFIELFNLYTDIVNDPARNSVQYKSPEPIQHKRLCLNSTDLINLDNADIGSSLFVVTAEARVDGKAVEIATMGCGWDENTITGVVYNSKPIYDSAVRYANALGESCSDSSASAFEDFILKYYGFDFALRCGDVCQALYYWNNYLNSGSSFGPSMMGGKGCGCHGTY